MSSKVVFWSAKVRSLLEKLRPISLLLCRLAMGLLFLEAGYGKLTHLEKVIRYFDSLGIPFASAQAPFVASLEFIGGMSLLLGILTRFFSIQLIGVMTVALITALSEKITGVTDLFSISEFLNIIILFSLATHGAGPLSLDRVIFKNFSKR